MVQIVVGGRAGLRFAEDPCKDCGGLGSRQIDKYRQIDRQIDRWIDRYTDTQTDRQTNKQADGTDRKTNRQQTSERERRERTRYVLKGVHHILFIYKLYQLRDITAIID